MEIDKKEQIKKIAKTLAEAMIEKVREQGLIVEIMDNEFGFDELNTYINYYFGLELVKDGRIYIHNCGKFSEDEIELIELIYNSIVPLCEETEEDNEAS